MLAFLIGISAAILAAAFHAAGARRIPKSWRFISVPVFGILVLFGICVIVELTMNNISAETILVALVISISLNIANALFLNGIYFDSPTLALINEIIESEPAGMPIKSLAAFAARHPFMTSRLAALAEDGIIVDDGSSITINGKIGLLLQLAEFYRGLCRRNFISG
jgi:hypothetical protein